jgi:uncharacterized protein YjbI with pentapeptide repeats
VDFTGAILRGADLSGADLSGADLTRATVGGPGTSGFILKCAKTDARTRLPAGYRRPPRFC